MEIKPLKLAGAYEITLAPRVDERGYFTRVFDDKIFRQHGLTTAWVQENQSRSTRKHLIRGLHFQAPPHAETKLVRVVVGAILDVFVDLRRSSPTYGQWASLELAAENFKMAYIPKGFAHAFCTLTDDAVVQYKVDAYYAPAAEGGLCWNDPALRISWPTHEPVLSAKDQAWPAFADFVSPFP
jgi:dTDP-4-dehydrorhamnose 3,5-epimerase